MKSLTYRSIFNSDNDIQIVLEELPFIITRKDSPEENVAPQVDMYHIDHSRHEAYHLGELYPVLNTNTVEVRINTVFNEEDGSDQIILSITDDIEAAISNLWEHRCSAEKN
jgi:hypothetical protein